MSVFKKLIRRIKTRLAASGLKLMRYSAQVAEPFIEECEQKLKSDNPDSILSSCEVSPVRGDEQIISNLEELDVTLKEAHQEDIDDMHIRGRDVFVAIPLFFRMRQIRSGLKKSYKDLKQNSKVQSLIELEMPNNELWEFLKKYAEEKWHIKSIGFTKIPPELIFQGKHILYPHALVLIEEMRKKKIDTAPLASAGGEAIRVYAHLGHAVIDIARWLRKKGVKCQANHPTGGLTLTPPLAAKAGLGWQGQMGLLISPEFGARQRIGTIFIEHPIFQLTDSTEHRWIEDYCQTTCGLCVKRCPGGAIFNQRKVTTENIEGIGPLRTCVDLMKCFKQFDLKFGCSTCLKVCPFSQGSGSYERIKRNFEKN